MREFQVFRSFPQLKADLILENIEDYASDWYLEAYSYLPRVRQERVDRFRFERDRRAGILSGYIVYEALLKRGISFDNMAFNEHGKPYILDGGFYFSISHKPPVVAVALSDERAVGADIEEVSSYNEGIVRRFFTESEGAYLASLNESRKMDRASAFYYLWTCKEAYGKLLGGGLNDGLSVSFEGALEKGLISTERGDYCFRLFSHGLKDKLYVGAVCGPQIG